MLSDDCGSITNVQMLTVFLCRPYADATVKDPYRNLIHEASETKPANYSSRPELNSQGQIAFTCRGVMILLYRWVHCLTSGNELSASKSGILFHEGGADF
jgi:hypothetical protein